MVENLSVDVARRHLRYLAGAFVDASSIVPNPQDITQLMTAFSQKGFNLLPNVVYEATPNGPVQRMGFTSPDGWQILLVSGRFDVVRSATHPLGSDLGDFTVFCGEASEILATTLEHFRRNAHRLAAVQERYLDEVPDEQMTEIGRRLLHLPNTYASASLSEWDWRAVTKMNRHFGNDSEPTNTITTIKRAVGAVIELGMGAATQVSFDRIQVILDINTLPDVTTARFDADSVRNFLAESSSWHSELNSEVTAFITGS